MPISGPEKFRPVEESLAREGKFEAREKRREEEIALGKELLKETPGLVTAHFFESGSIEPPKKAIPPVEKEKIRTLRGVADGKAVNLYSSRENRVVYKEDGHEVKWYTAAQNDANLLCELMLEGVINIEGISRDSRRFHRLQYVLTSIASAKGGNLETDRQWARMLRELRKEGFSYDEISNYKGALNVLVAFQRAIAAERKRGISIDDFKGENSKFKFISLTLSPQKGKKHRALYVIDEEIERPRVAKNTEK